MNFVTKQLHRLKNLKRNYKIKINTSNPNEQARVDGSNEKLPAMT